MATNFNAFTASDALNKKYKERDEAGNAVTNYGDFTASEYLNQALNDKLAAENAVNSYGDFNSKYQEAAENAMNNYLNRKEFSYDLNGDALYQQYKDQYMRQGNLAMMDTIGQAAAMTGGYGNSYAQSVGQQTYQGYLQGLNDKIPELYQLALSKYNQEGQDLYDKYSMLTNERNNEYNMWNDGYNRLVANRDYAGNNYYNTYSKEYGEWNDAYNKLKDAYDIANTDANNLYNQEYNDYSTDISNQKWQEEYELSERTADQSDTIAALKNQLNQQNDNAILYDEVSSVKSGLMDKSTFDSKKTATHREDVAGPFVEGVKYNGETYYTYEDYVKAYLKNANNTGKISTQGTFDALVNFYEEEYGIKIK